MRREASHPASGLDRPVAGMQDRAVVQRGQPRRQLVDPLDGEAVVAQGVVLAAQSVALGCIGGEAQAADPPERVAGELLHAVERPFGERHQPPCRFGAELRPRAVVGQRRTAEREAAVAPARTAGDLARFVQAHAHAVRGQRQGARAAGDTAADHRHLRASREARRRPLAALLLEPVGRTLNATARVTPRELYRSRSASALDPVPEQQASGPCRHGPLAVIDPGARSDPA